MYEGVVEQGSWELKFMQFWGLSSFTFFCFIQHRVYLALIVVEHWLIRWLKFYCEVSSRPAPFFIRHLNFKPIKT